VVSASTVSTGLSSPAATAVGQRKSIVTAIPSCGGCGVLMTDGVKSLQCDRCQGDSENALTALTFLPTFMTNLILRAALNGSAMDATRRCRVRIPIVLRLQPLR